MTESFSPAYLGNPIRPPAEADSLILQLTAGCPHNRCAFCGAYQGLPFRVRTPDEFRDHLKWVSRNEPWAAERGRVFLADGDSMVLPTPTLLEAFSLTRSAFPEARRFAVYSGPKGILAKPEADLGILKQAGLNTLYLGLESGSERILAAMGKGATAEEMIVAVQRAQKAGLRVSVMVLLGLGGPEHSLEHSRATAEVLNRMQPRLLSVLTLMLIPGTPLWQQHRAGTFTLISSVEALRELRELIARLQLQRTVFAANHASSFLPMTGALPRDQHRLLEEIDAGLSGQRPLTPEFLRGL